MSFILDALKKSETERQRADSPALYEMKMAPPRRGVAAWLIVLGALLAINIVVLLVVLLRGGHGSAATTDTTVPAPPPAAPVAPTVTATPAPAPAPPIQSAMTVTAPPVTADNSAATGPASDSTEPPVGRVIHQSDDDTPAVEPPRAASGNAPGGVTRAAGAGAGDVPSYDQAASTSGANLPSLKLDLHSYSSNPAERFIFLNMLKLREGEANPAGVRVESITPEGAILSWQGSRFLLRPQ